MTNATASIVFEPGTFDFALDRISALLDAQGFPVLHADLEKGTILVDASADPSDYSVLMAASTAAQKVGVLEEELLHVELV